MTDILYCASPDCPFHECETHITNCPLPKNQVVSVADLSGICHDYIAWLVDIKIQEENNVL